jgi:5-methylcytosine-specific restriction endonuclease McrA
LQLEHRTPISRGGSHWPANLAPACGRCNTAKGELTEKEYRERVLPPPGLW